MTNPVEPTDVGPAVGGDLAVAEDDRQHVITLLRAAHAEGRLSLVERDNRVAAAQQATVFDDLVPLTRDLVTAAPNPPSYATPSYATAGSGNSADQVVAIFSGAKRSGPWQVRTHTSILATFGGVELDLTEAVFDAREIEVTVFCLFGGIELTVPPGTQVHNHAVAVFGGAETKRLGIHDPQAPVITVKGFIGFGGLEIRAPKRSRREG